MHNDIHRTVWVCFLPCQALLTMPQNWSYLGHHRVVWSGTGANFQAGIQFYSLGVQDCWTAALLVLHCDVSLLALHGGAALFVENIHAMLTDFLSDLEGTSILDVPSGITVILYATGNCEALKTSSQSHIHYWWCEEHKGFSFLVKCRNGQDCKKWSFLGTGIWPKRRGKYTVNWQALLIYGSFK